MLSVESAIFAPNRPPPHRPSRGEAGLAIGQAAAITGVSAKMIRYYERIGLLPPASRTAANYRLYGPDDLAALRFIARGRALGFSIPEIARLLGLWREPDRASAAVKEVARGHLAELDARIAELQAMRQSIAALTAHCPGDSSPDCPILDALENAPHG